MPWSRASYSAMLLVHGVKSRQRMYRSLSPFGDVSTIPAPAPSAFLEPSKCRLQQWRYGSFYGYWASSQSARKSARAYDLIALRGSYLMLWTPITTAHLAA